MKADNKFWSSWQCFYRCLEK